MKLAVHNFSKRYDNTQAVQHASLELAQNEVVALLGPSGCGKSTLLRLIAGLERADTGKLQMGTTDMTHVPPERRQFGMVFQDYALFPHLNVYQNVAFGLVEQGLPKPVIRERVAALLALTELSGLETRRPAQLSGGQQQRVALARALAPEPHVLLLDEPLSNIDEHLRGELQKEMRALLKRLGMQAIYVTHDQNEAARVADRIAVMRAGTIVQTGTYDDVTNKPLNRWVAQFMGRKNVLEVARLAHLAPPLPSRYALLREQHIRLANPGEEAVALHIREVEPRGQHFAVTLVHPLSGVEIRWDAFLRELPTESVAQFVIPKSAWWPLENA